MTNEVTDQELVKANGSSRLKRFGIGLLVATVVGAALYFGGWWQARSQFEKQRAELEGQLQEGETQLQQMQEKLAVTVNRSYLIQARAALYQTLVALDRRNFGTANTHIQEAATVLKAVQAEPAGVEAEKLDALRSAVANNNINVAVDLELQRTRVLEFARQLNALMPLPADMPSVTPPAVPSAVP